MTVVKIRQYKGARILILNEWQKFIYVIFFKGDFYAYDFTISKRGEYTNKEYLQALDAALVAAKSTIDQLRKQRSLTQRIKQYVKHFTASLPQRRQGH